MDRETDKLQCGGSGILKKGLEDEACEASANF